MEALIYLFSIIIFASALLVHEAGHWALLRRYDVGMTAYSLGLGPTLFSLGRFHFKLFPLGATITPEPLAYAALKPMKRFWVALAGPWFSALYGCLLIWLATSLTGAQREGLILLGQFNWLIAGFNMLPLPPLDGFRAVEAVLESYGRPLSVGVAQRMNRLGNGLIYATAGFFIGSLLTRGMP